MKPYTFTAVKDQKKSFLVPEARTQSKLIELDVGKIT